METSSKRKSSYREKRKKVRQAACSCCKTQSSFNWQCRCGFAICQNCMDENFWGMSCNGITWVCPDCGDSNGFGNQ
ncbi:Uncharacterized protein dnl_27670 [Desulfonema limicola]|uniref:Uncharacterized protein n=1 Tax=Desulfonema limicola TaxID=45656 RepID=A0A975B887_9BACT|nr:hypothetical protein [Desulfonema limicola]QTA80462.1 Uncharacterized protein dnl_27670 [Desulfonema limicola]